MLAALAVAGTIALTGCSTSGQNHGVFTMDVIGRVTNPEGTCVATAYRGPYSNHGTVCAGKRLAAAGQCVQFSVSNDKASRSLTPDVGSVVVLGQERCRGL